MGLFDLAEIRLADLEARVAALEGAAPVAALQVLDSAAAYMVPGDTVRLYWDADPDNVIDVAIRVLEITRDNEGGPASLLVGSRITGLADRLLATARKLDSMSRMQ